MIGVGFEGAWSFYFIFNDGTKTETKSDFIFQDTQRQVADLSNFREVFIDPEDSEVRKVRLRYRNKNYAGNQTYVGTLCGVQFINDKDKSILKAGHTETENSQYTYHEFKLEPNERIVGVKGGRRKEAFIWDVQFVIAKKD